MKGDISFQSIFLVLEIIMLIFFGILIIRLLGAFTNPDLQTALLNTQVLKSKMNEACITGTAQMDGFRLTQPPINKAFTTLSTGFAKFAIKSSGDPQYVLYYEAFPYGEGVGWEALQNFDNRIFTYYKYPGNDDSVSIVDFENDLWRSSDAANPPFVARVDLLVGQKFSTDEGKDILKNHPEVLAYRRYVLVNNVELTDQLGAIPAYSVYNAPDEGEDNQGNANQQGMPQPEIGQNPEERVRKITESFGEWNDDKTFFKYSNYLGLDDVEQSFIKYRPCGENSLCLKTREGVYKFPLGDECKNIKYIGIYYDRRGADKKLVFSGVIAVGAVAAEVFLLKGVLSSGITKMLNNLASRSNALLLLTGGTAVALGNFVSNMASATLSYKNSDFYFASPCEVPGKIEIKSVDCREICDKSIRYPIYAYSGDKVIKTGEHVSCMASIGDDFSDDYKTLDPITNNGNEKNCLQVVIEERPKDFCWTPNPDTNGFLGLSITKGAAKLAGSQPITSNSFYMVNDDARAVFIKKIELQNALKHLFASAFDVDWVWPSGFLVPQTK